MQSWIFSIITSVFSVTWSFRNHSNMLICYSRNIIINAENSYSVTILWKPWYIFFRIIWWLESCIYLKQKSFVNVSTVIFDQFNASLLNKCINCFQKSELKVHLEYLLHRWEIDVLLCHWLLIGTLYRPRGLLPTTSVLWLWSSQTQNNAKYQCKINCVNSRMSQPFYYKPNFYYAYLTVLQ